MLENPNVTSFLDVAILIVATTSRNGLQFISSLQKSDTLTYVSSNPLSGQLLLHTAPHNQNMNSLQLHSSQSRHLDHDFEDF
jgi:hypothetical protein